MIPPPGYKHDSDQPIVQKAEQDKDNVHICDLICTSTGQPCGMQFSTRHGLLCHQNVSKMHVEKQLAPFSLIQSNFRPWCMRSYSDLNSTRTHVHRASKQGRCSGRGGYINAKLREISEYKCPCCEDSNL